MGEGEHWRLQSQSCEQPERWIGEAGRNVDDRHARRAVGVVSRRKRGA